MFLWLVLLFNCTQTHTEREIHSICPFYFVESFWCQSNWYCIIPNFNFGKLYASLCLPHLGPNSVMCVGSERERKRWSKKYNKNSNFHFHQNHFSIANLTWFYSHSVSPFLLSRSFAHLLIRLFALLQSKLLWITANSFQFIAHLHAQFHIVMSSPTIVMTAGPSCQQMKSNVHTQTCTHQTYYKKFSF